MLSTWWLMEILRIFSEEQLLLCDKAFNIAKNPKYNGYQRDLAWMTYIFFVKKSTSSGGVKNYNMSNQQLAKELYKPIVKSFEKREVYSSLIDNIWEADLADT